MSKFKVGDRVVHEGDLYGTVDETSPDSPEWFKVRLDWENATSWVPDNRFESASKGRKK